MRTEPSLTPSSPREPGASSFPHGRQATSDTVQPGVDPRVRGDDGGGGAAASGQARPRGSQGGHAAPEPTARPTTPFAEWLVAALGLALLAGSIGLLGWDALRHPPTPPSPVAEVVAIEPQPGGHLVRVRVANRGTRPAAALKLVARLEREGRVVEESDTEFQYLAGSSSREGGVWFAQDPRGGQVRLQVRSYQQP